MAQGIATRHPAEWLIARLPSVPRVGPDTSVALPVPAVRRVGADAVVTALLRGADDFLACRTDVIALCVLYPLVGLLLGYLLLGAGLMPLALPVLAGFSLLGPLFATGLYEMSRRREQGLPAGWGTAFSAFKSPAIGSILALGCGLLVVFAVWLGVADILYRATMGPAVPVSVWAFVHDVFNTQAGHTMLVWGMGIGFVFAVGVLVTNVVSFPLLLDRNVGVAEAVRTSLQVVRVNPLVSALWGLVIAGLLMAGSALLLIGLAVAMPLLGHASWHFYRQVLPD